MARFRNSASSRLKPGQWQHCSSWQMRSLVKFSVRSGFLCDWLCCTMATELHNNNNFADFRVLDSTVEFYIVNISKNKRGRYQKVTRNISPALFRTHWPVLLFTLSSLIHTLTDHKGQRFGGCLRDSSSSFWCQTRTRFVRCKVKYGKNQWRSWQKRAGSFVS